MWAFLSLHFVLMANFMVLPQILQEQLHIARNHHGMLYFPLLAFAFVMMLPFVIIAEKRRKIKPRISRRRSAAVGRYGIGIDGGAIQSCFSPLLRAICILYCLQHIRGNPAVHGQQNCPCWCQGNGDWNLFH